VVVTLAAVGGPAPGAPRPLAGTVSFGGIENQMLISVRVGATGTAKVSLPIGKWGVTGRSPRYGSNRYPCQAEHTVIVKARDTVRVGVYCQEK
jgi:hypothetical protein